MGYICFEERRRVAFYILGKWKPHISVLERMINCLNSESENQGSFVKYAAWLANNISKSLFYGSMKWSLEAIIKVQLLTRASVSSFPAKTMKYEKQKLENLCVFPTSGKAWCLSSWNHPGLGCFKLVKFVSEEHNVSTHDHPTIFCHRHPKDPNMTKYVI